MFDIYDKSKGGSYSDTLSQSSDDRRDADEVSSLKIRVCERQPNYFENRYILRTGLLLILLGGPGRSLTIRGDGKTALAMLKIGRSPQSSLEEDVSAKSFLTYKYITEFLVTKM